MNLKNGTLTGVLLLGAACGPQGDVDWIYTDGQVTLGIDVRRDGVPSLSVVGEGGEVRPEQDGCFDATELQGSTRQRLQRGVFGDLDFSDFGNAVSLCGPLEWDLGNGPATYQVQLEYGVGGEAWFWANLWMPDGSGSIDMWAQQPDRTNDANMQSGSVATPVRLTAWGERGASPCPSGNEWCEMGGELTLSWSFSEEFVERPAW